MTNNNPTGGQVAQWLRVANEVLSAGGAGTPERVLSHGVIALHGELQQYRKAATPELKPANLINKFYERYPLAGFKTDGERSEALGYFLAGAELQCFGEFIKYEDLCGDE